MPRHKETGEIVGSFHGSTEPIPERPEMSPDYNCPYCGKDSRYITELLRTIHYLTRPSS